MFKQLLSCCLLSGASLMAIAQSGNEYSPSETFKPNSWLASSATRTATGRPGAAYWQNRADYKVTVSFDTLTRIIAGKVSIQYFNNSPETLPYLWLKLPQNRFRKDSKTAALTPVNGTRFGVQENTDGFSISKVWTGDPKKNSDSSLYMITDEYMKINLAAPLKPGTSVSLGMDFSFLLPRNGSDYMGVLNTKNGAVYQVSQWFPKISVYDDILGWNIFTNGYYIEPGKLDYSITAPANLIVQGTGELMNPAETLTAKEQQQLLRAMKSDSVITIRSAGSIQQPRDEGKKTRTWRFHADNVGDAMWAASAAFIWDAVKVDLGGNRTATAMTLYPVESSAAAWSNATAHAKKILEYYSRQWIPYPYKTMAVIGGGVTGLASCGVSFIQYTSTFGSNGLWSKLNHELGHSWFNIMITGSARQNWMCEGLNSFINDLSGKHFNEPAAFTIKDATSWVARTKEFQPLTEPYELILYDNFALHAYVKPALALHLLRTQVLGSEKFDAAFRDYMRTWAFKHPSGENFFRFMEDHCGEDLSWFWNGWFRNNWRLDQSIEKVEYLNNSPDNGAYITIKNRDKMAMPVEVEVQEENGKTARMRLPAEVWSKHREWTFLYASTSPIVRIKLDPDRNLPDYTRSNNVWEGSGK
ncbi:M1 family metallopeptidase [Pseudoflavitalea sp. G-6-1-2]|uniref:M1 family metallopeptidase n=1 Tax=Pseudoflavitalea sp. G-6-1-2 TaxID=2728841 RepID=UPI001469C31D|nr:M1 family metallopeptidase [Pseudoflavitalea sp. G-6-1-2]NML22329.1 M1 family metallopeptidase [Pseudoflavitalea sp. G-6-1-2]